MFMRAAVNNIPGSCCSLNTFFPRSRLSQARQRHLGPLSVVKPLEATSMAVLREATLKKRVTTRFVPMRIGFPSVRFEQLNSAN